MGETGVGGLLVPVGAELAHAVGIGLRTPGAVQAKGRKGERKGYGLQYGGRFAFQLKGDIVDAGLLQLVFDEKTGGGVGVVQFKNDRLHKNKPPRWICYHCNEWKGECQLRTDVLDRGSVLRGGVRWGGMFSFRSHPYGMRPERKGLSRGRPLWVVKCKNRSVSTSPWDASTDRWVDEGLVCIFFCSTKENKGVDAVEPASSNSPPDCCI